MRYQNKIAKENKQYGLDYIMNLPSEFRSKQMSRAKQEKAWNLRILHKNVVIRRIQEIKILKAKPGLKEAIQITMAKKAEQDEKVRSKLKARVMALYEKEIA